MPALEFHRHYGKMGLSCNAFLQQRIFDLHNTQCGRVFGLVGNNNGVTVNLHKRPSSNRKGRMNTREDKWKEKANDSVEGICGYPL